MNLLATIKVLFALLLFLSALYARAGIVGSAHDFSSKGWSGNQICIVCHTPHNSNTSITDAPLWNHQITSATYTLYSSPTLAVAPVQPRGPSKLCLSCHDGSVAIDSFGGNGGTTTISGSRDLGVDLSDDHPVSIEWRHQEVETSGDFCFNCHFGPDPQLVFFRPGGSGPIWVECSTCHDVHNLHPEYPALLRRSLVKSELCMVCHEK